jgi:hypothetical protein
VLRDSLFRADPSTLSANLQPASPSLAVFLLVEATAGQENARRKVMGSAINPTTMTDSPHSHNSKYNGLRSGRHRSLLAKMPKPKLRKRLRPRGFFGRWKWVLIPVVALLLIPAMQVVVVRFINPPWTLPMLIDQGGTIFSSAPKHPLLYRWVDLPQIPEMFLEHLWISEDQRFFQHEGFDWKEMDLALKEADRKLDVMYANAPYTVIQRAMHIHPTVTELIPTMLDELKPLK